MMKYFYSFLVLFVIPLSSKAGDQWVAFGEVPQSTVGLPSGFYGEYVVVGEKEFERKEGRGFYNNLRRIFGPARSNPTDGVVSATKEPWKRTTIEARIHRYRLTSSDLMPKDVYLAFVKYDGEDYRIKILRRRMKDARDIDVQIAAQDYWGMRSPRFMYQPE